MGLDLSHAIPTKNKTLEYFLRQELSSNQEFIDRYKDWFQKNDEGEDVLYIDEKGYQRKGMVKDFYVVFENDIPYFEKKDVERAMLYIDINSPFSADFKENFIDNFVEGESIFFASW